MSQPMVKKAITTIQIEYFTKEFPGYEIESKWSLLSQTPVITMLQFLVDIEKGYWSHFKVQKTMGFLPVGIRYLELNFHFFGKYENGHWEQVAMVAQIPGKNSFQLAFKRGGDSFCLGETSLSHSPLIRKESRKGNWISEKQMLREIKIREPDARFVATMARAKCSVYITNAQSYRNFNLSGDLCHGQGCYPLSQIEIEYKGRSGIWLPDRTGAEILKEFAVFNCIIEDRYRDICTPSMKTKFEWLLEKVNK